MTAYTELLDLNANPSNPRLYAGDYITSPNGIYYGILQDNGQFVVNHGTNPVTSAGSTSAWSTSAARLDNQQFEAALSGGDFGVLGSITGIVYQIGNFNKDSINSFATISDAGELTVTSGTPSNPSVSAQPGASTGCPDRVIRTA